MSNSFGQQNKDRLYELTGAEWRICASVNQPLSEPIMEYCILDPWEQIQWDFIRNLYIFIRENAFEILDRKLAIIVSLLQYKKWNPIEIKLWWHQAQGDKKHMMTLWIVAENYHIYQSLGYIHIN